MYRFLKDQSIRFHHQIRTLHHHGHDGGDDDVRDRGGHGRGHRARDGGDDDRILIPHQNRFQLQVISEYPFLCEVRELQIPVQQ